MNMMRANGSRGGFGVVMALVVQAVMATGEEPAEAFRVATAALAEKAGSAMTVAGADGWLFLTNELRHTGAGVFWGEAARKVSRAAKPEEADPMPAILDFKRQLDAQGIGLLVVPVPPKAVVYPDKSAGMSGWVVPERVDGALGEFYGALRAKGVPVVDLTEVFLAARGKGGEPYCRQDSHWSGAGCELAAGQLAEMIRKEGWYGAVVRGEFQSKETTVTLSGDLREALAEGERPERESVRLRVVSGKDGKPVMPERGSPVVLMGDSHNLVFHAGADMHATGAGLPDQLALELGFAVDLVAVRGSGATPARINLYRNGRADAGYLKGKKLVIWCFAAREFTESQGWRLVPVSK